jgi:hypothetical protein
MPGDIGEGGNAGEIGFLACGGKLGEVWSLIGGEGRAFRRGAILDIPESAGDAG